MPPQEKDKVVVHNNNNNNNNYNTDNDNNNAATTLPPSYQHQTTTTTTSVNKNKNNKRNRIGKKNKKHRMKNHDEINNNNSDSSNQSEEEEDEPQHELTQIRHANGPRYGHVHTSEQAQHHDDDDAKRRLSIDEAVEMLGMGPFQYRILLAAGLCFAADSMEVLLLSFLAVVLKAVWNLSDQQTSFITSSVFIGALIGTLVLGYLGDRIGRKPVFTLTAGIICLAGFLTAVANNFWTLLAFRFLVGFGVGGLCVPFDTLAEFVPNSHRGSNLLLIEYFWTAGTLCEYKYILSERRGTRRKSWCCFLTTIPSVLLCMFVCVLQWSQSWPFSVLATRKEKKRKIGASLSYFVQSLVYYPALLPFYTCPNHLDGY